MYGDHSSRWASTWGPPPQKTHKMGAVFFSSPTTAALPVRLVGCFATFLLLPEYPMQRKIVFASHDVLNQLSAFLIAIFDFFFVFQGLALFLEITRVHLTLADEVRCSAPIFSAMVTGHHFAPPPPPLVRSQKGSEFHGDSGYAKNPRKHPLLRTPPPPAPSRRGCWPPERPRNAPHASHCSPTPDAPQSRG